MDRRSRSRVGSAISESPETKELDMSHNTLLIGWNRSIPGREKHSLEH
jgi:hypothetical protein